MLTARIFPIILTSTDAFVECNRWNWSRDPIPTIIADCHAALNIIPDGTITFDGVVRRPLHFTLPSNARDPKVRAPAMFRSGHCAISVIPDSHEHDDNFTLHLPIDAASMLYFKTWPAVRTVAQSIIDMCLPEERTGNTGGTAITEFVGGSDGEIHVASYVVSAHIYSAGPLGRFPFDIPMNVYQANKSGKVTRSRYEVY